MRIAKISFLKFFVILTVLAVLTELVYSFDLCPACSPEIVSSESNLPDYMLGKGKFSFIALSSLGEIKSDHAEGHSQIEQALVSSNYGITNHFKAGLMYGFSSQKLSLQIDYLLLQEKDIRPSLILGIGSFRGIFSESHPYVIAIKSIQPYVKLPIKISAGIKHKGDDLSKPQSELVGNLIFRVYRSVHIMGIFEGQEFDLAMYGVMFDRLIFGMRMIELKTPAVGIVWRM